MAGKGVMKITVDLDLCTGHGLCEAMAPEVFALDADGFCSILLEEVSGDMVSVAEEAAFACPTRAIEMTESNETTVAS